MYLYGAAHPGGRRLAEVRRALGYFRASRPAQWEGALAAADLAACAPDLGPPAPSERAGVATIGAGPWVVNFNLPLLTEDMAAARRVSRAVSERGGGLAGVEAMALRQESGSIEVACNLTDASASPPAVVEARIAALAAAEGLALGTPYIIGKLPAEMLALAAAHGLSGGGG